MYILFQDLRYTLRTIQKNIMLTVVIVVSLAIGIGANSANFSVVDALLLRPLPYPHPERLAAVWLHSPAVGIFRDWLSPGEYIDVQNENHSFEETALAGSQIFVLTGREQPERLFGMRTQSSLLEMLGAKPLLGRLLMPEDDQPGKADVAILSERAWKRLFNSDPGIVGKTIVLNGNPFNVAGVLQGGFVLTAEVMPSEIPKDKMDIFAPLPLGADACVSNLDCRISKQTFSVRWGLPRFVLGNFDEHAPNIRGAHSPANPGRIANKKLRIGNFRIAVSRVVNSPNHQRDQAIGDFFPHLDEVYWRYRL